MSFTILRFDPDLLPDHYERHKGDFGAISEQDYENLARSFLTAGLSSNSVPCRACPRCHCIAYGSIHECVLDGDVIRFNTVTTELAVKGANGFIRTYYKPKPTGNKTAIQRFHYRCKPKP